MSKGLSIKKFTTQRGFHGLTFVDRNGSRCSMQESSLVSDADGTRCLWFGIDTDPDGRETSWRMEFSQKQLRQLLPWLMEFTLFGFINHHPAESGLKTHELSRARAELTAGIRAYLGGQSIRAAWKYFWAGLFNEEM